MRLDAAVKMVANFRRYRQGKRRTYWDQSGPLVPQCLIPNCTKAQERKRDRIMTTKDKLGAVRWVDVGRIRSTQHCLRFKNLMWHVKHHAAMQKVFRSKDMDIRGVNLPIVTWVDGVPILWNGNHRVTASVLLGKARIMVRMYKLGKGSSRAFGRRRPK